MKFNFYNVDRPARRILIATFPFCIRPYRHKAPECFSQSRYSVHWNGNDDALRLAMKSTFFPDSFHDFIVS